MRPLTPTVCICGTVSGLAIHFLFWVEPGSPGLYALAVPNISVDLKSSAALQLGWVELAHVLALQEHTDVGHDPARDVLAEASGGSRSAAGR